MHDDSSRTKKELIEENAFLKQISQELEKSEARLKQTEAKLRESQQKFRSIFDQAYHFIAMISLDGMRYDINSTVMELAGVREEDCTGKPFWDTPFWTHSPELQNRIRQAVAEAAKGNVLRFEATHVDIDGGKHYTDLSLKPVKDKFGKITYLLAEGRDITERKKAEEEERRRLEAENFRRGLDESPLGVRILETGGDIIYANQALLDIYGYDSIEELKTTPIENLFAPESFVEHLKRKEIIKRGIAYPSEYNLSIIRKDGRMRHLQLFRKDILWNGEKHSLVLCNDVTEHRQAEMALKERTIQLGEANKELESFSYSVSHDLRSPLRAIDGYARMILNKEGENFDEDTKRKFNIIRMNARRMAELIEDLLTLSHLGRKQIAKTSLNMDEIVKDVWNELQALKPDRNFTLSIKTMPPGYGDRTLVKQIYLNLLDNAVKFTKNRDVAHIEIGSRIDNRECVYFVKDNGVGFDMAYYDKLFGIFQRLHSDDEFQGTGVGLAIIQRIIQKHGGSVWAEGKVDEGSCFYFTLPKERNMSPVRKRNREDKYKIKEYNNSNRRASFAVTPSH